jgi:hypothetical protein
VRDQVRNEGNTVLVNVHSGCSAFDAVAVSWEKCGVFAVSCDNCPDTEALEYGSSSLMADTPYAILIAATFRLVVLEQEK